MEHERRSGADRRHQLRRREDKEKTYEILAYELDCKNDDLKDISNEISDMHKKMNKG